MGLSAELREHMLAAAEKLGYRTNLLAHSMSTGVSHTLGVIVADIKNPFFAGVVRGTIYPPTPRPTAPRCRGCA